MAQVDEISAMAMGGSKRLIGGMHSRGNLPHLKKLGASYFVTFRLRGSLPKEALLQFKAERQAIVNKALAARRSLTWSEQEEVFRWYSERVDSYLDSGQGSCLLRDEVNAGIVADALRFFDRTRYALGEWVVMPNHVHVVVRPFEGISLSGILQSWKGFTARKINGLLKCEGPLWQVESYDHLIRDDADRIRCGRYVRENPVKAGLCSRAEEWRWGSAFEGE